MSFEPAAPTEVQNDDLVIAFANVTCFVPVIYKRDPTGPYFSQKRSGHIRVRIVDEKLRDGWVEMVRIERVDAFQIGFKEWVAKSWFEKTYIRDDQETTDQMFCHVGLFHWSSSIDGECPNHGLHDRYGNLRTGAFCGDEGPEDRYGTPILGCCSSPVDTQ